MLGGGVGVLVVGAGGKSVISTPAADPSTVKPGGNAMLKEVAPAMRRGGALRPPRRKTTGAAMAIEGAWFERLGQYGDAALFEPQTQQMCIQIRAWGRGQAG